MHLPSPTAEAGPPPGSRPSADPRVSPVFTALIDVLFAVDMVRMNVLFDGDPIWRHLAQHAATCLSG
jgi:hypothetical protein